MYRSAHEAAGVGTTSRARLDDDRTVRAVVREALENRIKHTWAPQISAELASLPVADLVSFVERYAADGKIVGDSVPT